MNNKDWVGWQLSMSLLWICGGGRRAADVEGSGPMGGESVMWKSNVIGWGLLAGDVFVERVMTWRLQWSVRAYISDED